MIALEAVKHAAEIVVIPKVSIQCQFGLGRHGCACIAARCHCTFPIRAGTPRLLGGSAIGDVWRWYWWDVLWKILRGSSILGSK